MPAKERDSSNAATAALLTRVLAMPHERQVALLSDALLREYMHRRGFAATLRAFDAEHPRDAETIASRALMANLLTLRDDDLQRLKAPSGSTKSNNNNNSADAADGSGRAWTVMELLCALRVERQREVQRLRAAAAAIVVPTVPEHYKQLIAAHEQQQQQQQGQHGSDDTASDADKMASPQQQQQQRRPQQHRHSRRHREGAVLRRSGRTLTTTLLDEAAATAMTMDDLLGPDDDDDDAKTAAALDTGRGDRLMQQQQQQQHDNNNNMYGSSDAQTATMTRSSNSNADSATNDTDDESDDDDDDGDGDEPLTEAEARELCAVVCGTTTTMAAAAAALPPMSFVQQGLVFDDASDCALVQLQRGCDAVLAVVQAHVAAYYYEKELYAEATTRQRACLQRALTTMLLRAQPDVTRIALVYHGARNGNKRDSHGGVEQQQQQQQKRTEQSPQQLLSRIRRGRFRVRRHFTTRDALDAAVAQLLQTPCYTTLRGCGVWCVVLSLVLSRGTDVVRAEMASTLSPSPSSRTLIDVDRGVGTMALLNLCLAGAAVSYAHDGTVTCGSGNSGGTAQPQRLTGYTATLACGVLCGDDGDKERGSSHLEDKQQQQQKGGYATAWRCAAHCLRSGDAMHGSTATYTRATEPTYASWVVCHGDCVVNVYMRKDTRRVVTQKRELGGAAVAEVLYYDAVTDDEPRMLRVTVAAGGGGGAGRGLTTLTAGRAHGALLSASPPPPPHVRNALRSVPLWSNATIEWADE